MSADTRFAFSKRRLDTLVPPATGRTHYRDARTPKLYLRVTAAGAKSFWYVTKHIGRTEWVRLGSYPDMSVAAARLRAGKVAGRFALEQNPAAELRLARSELTLGDLWAKYRAHYIRRGGASLRTLDSQWRVYLQPWEAKRLSEITYEHARKLRDRIADGRSRSLANRIVTMGKAMFNYAARELHEDVANPFAAVSKFSERGRIRRTRLRHDGIAAFFAALEELTPTMRDFFKCCLWIGARAGNIKTMRWADVDLDGGTWTIPHTKSGEGAEVALASPVVALLAARREQADSPWVFPAASRSGHLETYRKAWLKIVRQAKLGTLRVHDLRRSLASWAQEADVSIAKVAAQLGHRDAATTLRHYTQVASTPQRLAIEATVRAMIEAGVRDAN